MNKYFYVVKNDKGEWILSSARQKRKDSISSFIRGLLCSRSLWSEWKAQGYKCVKIKIQEIS